MWVHRNSMKAWRRLILVAFGAGVAIALTGLGWFNGRLTRYIKRDAFRVEIQKQTAKGLHFAEGHYEPIKRTGPWTAGSAGFSGKNGSKALRTMDAHGVSAKFNPWGVFQRLWY